MILDSEKYNLKILDFICAACTRKKTHTHTHKRMKERKKKREKERKKKLDNEEVTQKFKM